PQRQADSRTRSRTGNRAWERAQSGSHRQERNMLNTLKRMLTGQSEAAASPRRDEREVSPAVTDQPGAGTAATDVSGPTGVTLPDAHLIGWFLNDTGELFSGFPRRQEDHVLDVGCGNGGFSHFWARQGAEVTYVDIDAEK